MLAVTNPKTIDLDADLSDVLADSGEDVPVIPVKIFGETFHVRQDLNSWHITRLQSGDAGGISEMLLGVLDEDERTRFNSLLGRQKNFNEKKLVAVFQAVLGVAAGERPTSTSPASRRTTPKKVVARRSAAN